MSGSKKNKIQYTAADIEKYLLGNLSPAEMHAMEKAALDDPFLADAIEGVRHALQKNEEGSLHQDIAELKQRLENRIAEKQKTIPVFLYRGWWQAAAVLLTLAIIGVTTYLIIHTGSHTSTIATLTEKKEKQDNKNTDSSHVRSGLDVKADTVDVAAASSKKIIPQKPAEIQHKKKNETGYKKDDVLSKDDVASANNRPASRAKPQNAAAPAMADKEVNKTAEYEFAKPDTTQNYFLGKVTDKYNRPIVSASIELKKKKVNISTDKLGNFRFDIRGPDSSVNAEIRSRGYDPAFINLNNNGAANIIVLHESKSYLPQVTVGFGRSGKMETNQIIPQDAEPVNGWDQYKIYLDKNKKPPQDSLGLKGTVLVSFTVGKNMKPTDLSIEQSIGPGYDEEATRLIKEGPLWKLLKGKKARIIVVVNF